MGKTKDTRPALGASERRVVERGKSGGLELCQNGSEQLRRWLGFGRLDRCSGHIAKTGELANTAIAISAALLVLMVVMLVAIPGGWVLVRGKMGRLRVLVCG